MSQYLLSTYTVAGEVAGAPMTPEEMGKFRERVIALEAEMEASRTFVFGGALHDPDAATVVRMSNGDVVMTDGPFAESKEHIGGFYIINAADGSCEPGKADVPHAGTAGAFPGQPTDDRIGESMVARPRARRRMR